MKSLRVATLVAASGLFIGSLAAQETEFPGLKKAMAPEEYENAGLSKLTPEERAALDEFIRGYVSNTSQKAADAAVDKAVKEKKAIEPDVIQSRIVGPFRGYSGRSRFTLENGQVWEQSQRDTMTTKPIDSPPVIIVKAGWGHRMYILGGGAIRVSRVR